MLKTNKIFIILNK